MSETIEVTFYTAPYAGSNGRAHSFNRYDRVAGTSLYNQVLWQDKSQLAVENDYTPTNTEAVTYELPARLAKCIGDYFYDFYANPMHLYQVSDARCDRDERSNCHRFGATMLTSRPQKFTDSYAIVTELVGSNRLAEGYAQPLGELAVLGLEENRLGFDKHAVHTLVSLGDGNYIQTTAIAGNIAITDLPSVTSYYLQKPTELPIEVYSSAGADVNVSLPNSRFKADMDSLRRRIS